MLAIEWTKEGGWNSPQIVPFGPIAISPSASVLHYGLEVCYVFFNLLFGSLDLLPFLAANIVANAIFIYKDVLCTFNLRPLSSRY